MTKKKPVREKRQDRAVPWRVEYFKRHRDDDLTETEPGREFLRSVPDKVAARMRAVLEAVAEAPPPSYSGGGYWQAMHDEMAGYFEVRVDGEPNRTHYRLFCLLERDGAAVGLRGPSVVIITGLKKPFRTVLRKEDYAAVRQLGAEFRARRPRSVVQ